MIVKIETKPVPFRVRSTQYRLAALLARRVERRVESSQESKDARIPDACKQDG